MGQLLLRIAVAALVILAILATLGSFLPRDFDFSAEIGNPSRP